MFLYVSWAVSQELRTIGDKGGSKIPKFSIFTKEAAFSQTCFESYMATNSWRLTNVDLVISQRISNEIKLKGLQCLRKFLNSRGIICKGRKMGEMVNAAAFCLISSSLVGQTGEKQREVLPAGSKLHWKTLKKRSDLPQKIWATKITY